MSSGHLKISTKNKIRFARAASKIIRFVRESAGFPKIVKTNRHGCTWNLDLKEGIDFAIYLNLYEPHIIKALPRLIFEGDIVIDVGANIGALTLPFSKYTGKSGAVISIEPTVFAFEKLLNNVSLNTPDSSNIIPIHALLSNIKKIKIESIPSSWPLDGDRQNLHETHFGKNNPVGDARIVTLDELVDELAIDKVDLIKIDVDGNEMEVMEGGLTIIMKHRPKLIIEIAPHVHTHRKEGIETFLHFLRKLPYEVLSLDEKKHIPLREENFVYGQSTDILMWPK